MNDDVLRISQMLQTASFDEDVLNEIAYHYLDNLPVVHIGLPKRCKILRSSINNERNLFDNVQRLSYPPADKARTDRASLKGKPMFYASIFTSSAIEANAVPQLVSAMETTDILRRFDDTGLVFVTQSLWQPRRNLHLIAFPFSKALTKPCKEIQSFIKCWDEEFSNAFSESSVEFAEFIGNEMSQKNYSCLYDVTAHLIHSFLYKSKGSSSIDGIAYPSVWCDGQGMNICLKREVVDECIDFVRAEVERIEKIKGEANLLPIANSLLMPNEKLEWTFTPIGLKMLGDE